jgi:hypothetical protein
LNFGSLNRKHWQSKSHFTAAPPQKALGCRWNLVFKARFIPQLARSRRMKISMRDDYEDITPEHEGAGMNPALLGPLFLAGLLGALAINSQSVWVDEAVTAVVAAQASPFASWDFLAASSGSDTQMPGYMAYMWLWEKVLGYSEWWLRAANLPWLALAIFALPKRSGWFLGTLMVSPFLWYYLNEARPYLMQIGATVMVIGALWRLKAEILEGRREKITFGLLMFGLVLLSGSSLLGMIWAAAGLGAAVVILGREPARALALRCRWLAMSAAGLLGLLAVFYLWTIWRGNHATSGHTGLGNVAFVAYELAGLSGLGPGRVEMRGTGFSALQPHLALLLLQTLLISAVFYAGVRAVQKQFSRRVWLGVAGWLAGAALFLFGAAVAKHFSVLGRHFAPLAPVVLLVLSLGLKQLYKAGGWRRGLVPIFFIVCLISALSLRFAERHRKDDYRSAAAIALQAAEQGKNVWWCADLVGAAYYQVPVSPLLPTNAGPGKISLVLRTPPGWLTRQTPPDVLLFSKPELNDPAGDLRAFLSAQNYHLFQSLRAFTVWSKNGLLPVTNAVKRPK